MVLLKKKIDELVDLNLVRELREGIKFGINGGFKYKFQDW